ncbi:Lon protease family protein [Natranaerobius thermophilus]|uniref:endopeptidase La n=1 Tax=Natranaerobius thermophilus (strain ATCC BAA-1301 / DSM 18059 / JW/NM-WN-LF) TaxID=457570 RepID=B2A8J1_NATTJ|nr:AAA family ATPase [Natranaerobius thermophilus]ACB85875.1 peptidase S16 lon domain protein [Natranaerobius thermophilus JW/NM-WN-LF]
MSEQIAPLKKEQLKAYCDESQFEFNTTEELEPLKSIIGQDRAVKAMEFGLQINRQGYNLYMSGPTGTGKTSYAKAMTETYAKKFDPPSDWCYVYNFNEPESPRALELPAGEGCNLVEGMENLLEEVGDALTKAFKTETYEESRAQIFRDYQAKRRELVDKLNEEGEEYGFRFKNTSSGIVSVPVVDGKELNQDEFDELDTETKREIEENSSKLHVNVMNLMRELKDLDRDLKDELDKLKDETAHQSLSPLMDPMKERYQSNDKVLEYLEEVEEDIVKNVEHFISKDDDGDDGGLSFLKPQASKEDITKRYQVNLLVDNCEQEGAPVVVETNPTYYNLLGKMEYVNKMGTAVTDFNMIKPGAFHRANGGYLILQAKDVLKTPMTYELLKRVLNTGQLRLENLGEHIGMIAMSSLRPEDIPLNVKVIIVGNEKLYQLLYQLDEEFSKLFKIKVDFDSTMNRTQENVEKMASFIASHSQDEEFKSFTPSGVASVVEYSSRLAGHKKKLSTKFNEIVEIMSEADTWAALEGEDDVSREHVIKAIQEKKYRVNRPEEKIQEQIDEGNIMVDTAGEVTGQVNGLAVYDLGDLMFGKPFRITANVFPGERGIINIEREAKLSGKIHDKGVLILSGLINGLFSYNQKLGLSASLCCEQTYGGIDGDSASSTEVYAILSSAGEIPLRQDLAVTGSVNQKGEIQPVGGVTEKIEGFFTTCKIKGLTGTQGVIIPKQNENNLNLSEEVIEACERGDFHIYSISHIDEGMELLSGMTAGLLDKNEEEDTVYKRVKNRLIEFRKNLKSKQVVKTSQDQNKEQDENREPPH